MGLTKRNFLATSASLVGLSSCPQALETTEKLTDSKGKVFRDYDAAPEHVVRFYHGHHTNQTYAFAKAKREHYGKTLWKIATGTGNSLGNV